jgi:hypothetical protein
MSTKVALNEFTPIRILFSQGCQVVFTIAIRVSVVPFFSMLAEAKHW